MHCHSSSGQSSGLLFQKTMGAVTKAKWNHRRTIDALFHTGKQSKTLCLEKTTLRVRDYVQTLGLNAETKKDRHRAVGEIFVLTFPFIGLSPISAFYRLVDVATIDAVALLRHPPLV